jgi:FkbM family methyltransferase
MMNRRAVKLALLLAAAGQLLYFGFASTTGQVALLAAQGRVDCPWRDALDTNREVGAVLAIRDRFAKASRAIAFDGDLQLWETPSGRFWIPPITVKKFALVLAEQEAGIYGRGPRAVQPGDVVIDCGADVGTFTRSALSKGASKVVAVEPMPQKVECLRRTFAPEIAAGRVIVYPKGVWHKDDELVLYGDSVVEKRTSEGVRVPLTTLDKLVAELQLDRVDYIKMDTEGAEKNALAGGRGLLTRLKPRLAIAAEHLPDDVVALPRAVRALVSTYNMECGPCEYANDRLQPQVLYFF